MEDDHRIKVVFNRTFANVGSPNSTDTLSMHMPASIAVTIKPSFSSFSVLREKKSFTVQDYGPNIKQRPIISGTIMWSVVRRFTHFSLVLYTLPSPCLRFYRFLHVSRKDKDTQEWNPRTLTLRSLCIWDGKSITAIVVFSFEGDHKWWQFSANLCFLIFFQWLSNIYFSLFNHYTSTLELEVRRFLEQLQSSEKLGIRNGLLLIHMPIYLSQGRQPWISNITFSCLGKMKSFKDKTTVVKRPVFLESIRFGHY